MKRMTQKAHKRAHVVLPEELLRQIDELVGPRGRSAFLAELADKEVRRLRLLKLLSSDKPLIDPAAHPWWADSAKWVREFRDLDKKRYEEQLKRWEGE